LVTASELSVAAPEMASVPPLITPNADREPLTVVVLMNALLTNRAVHTLFEVPIE
jgi:hypothetical protein